MLWERLENRITSGHVMGKPLGKTGEKYAIYFLE
jgi:hypothetical protein